MSSISNVNGPNINVTTPIEEGLSEKRKISDYKTKYPSPIQSPYAIKIKTKVEYTPAAYLLKSHTPIAEKTTPDQTATNSSLETKETVIDDKSSVDNQPTPMIANSVQLQDKPLIYNKPKQKNTSQSQINRSKSTLNANHSLFVPKQHQAIGNSQAIDSLAVPVQTPTLEKSHITDQLAAANQQPTVQQASIKKPVNLSAKKKIVNNIHYTVSTPSLKRFKIAIYDLASGYNSKPRPPDDLVTHQQKSTVSANLENANILTKTQNENADNIPPTPTVVFPPEPPIVYHPHPLRTITDALKATIKEQHNKSEINTTIKQMPSHNNPSPYIQQGPSVAAQLFADSLKNTINQHTPKLNISLEYIAEATAKHRETSTRQEQTEEKSLKQQDNLEIKLEQQILAEHLHYNQQIAEPWNIQQETIATQQEQDAVEKIHLSSHKQQKKAYAAKLAAAKTKAKHQANRHMAKKIATLHLADKKIKNNHIVDRSA